MPDFEKLAEHLVAEISVAHLQIIILFRQLNPHVEWGGVFCGGGCRGGLGGICGNSCGPHAQARDVFDRENKLELTTKDFTDIYNDLPKLRQAVVSEVEIHLGQLRA